MLTPAVILHEVGETIEDMVRKITDLESLPIPSLFSHELADLFACYVLDGELFRRQTGVKHKNAYIRLKKLLLTREFSSEDLGTLRGAIQLERSDREASVGTFPLGEIDVIRRLAPWKYDENYSPKPLYLRTIQHK